MKSVNQMSEREKASVLAEVKKVVGSIEKKHGEEATRWAFNKIQNERRERRRIAKERRKLEDQLAALDK